MTTPIEILFIYAEKSYQNQDEKLLIQLRTQLEGSLAYEKKKNLVTFWDKRNITPGADIALEIEKHLKSASIILLLISADFMTLDFPFSDTMEQLLKKHSAEDTRVVPILLRSVSWENSPFGELAPLPSNGKFVNQWNEKDEAWANIAVGIVKLVKFLIDNEKAAIILKDGRNTSMSNQSFGNGYALFVGVGKDLKVTVKDATDLHNLFIDPQRAGYPSNQVTLLTETRAVRENILDALDRMAQQIEKDPLATAIVYFSGHGIKYTHTNGTIEYFLVPYGYDPARLKTTAISSQEFTAKLNALKARKLVVLLDCCHADGLTQFKAPGIEKSLIPPNLLDLQEGKGRVVIASSNADQLSYAGIVNSVFTACLIDALSGQASADQDGMARILDISRYLLKQVAIRSEGMQSAVISNINSMDENFALCFYAGGAKGLSGEPQPLQSQPQQPVQVKQAPRRIQRLKERQEELESTLAALNVQIKSLQEAFNYATSPLQKLEHEYNLNLKKAERQKVEDELDEIDQQLP